MVLLGGLGARGRCIRLSIYKSSHILRDSYCSFSVCYLSYPAPISNHATSSLAALFQIRTSHIPVDHAQHLSFPTAPPIPTPRSRLQSLRNRGVALYLTARLVGNARLACPAAVLLWLWRQWRKGILNAEDTKVLINAVRLREINSGDGDWSEVLSPQIAVLSRLGRQSRCRRWVEHESSHDRRIRGRNRRRRN